MKSLIMARNLIRRVIGASNRMYSNAQDTNWSASFDSLIARWQRYEDEMNYIRESKKLPLRWCPPAGKSKLSPVTLAEDCLLKKLSDKCSANETLSNEVYQPTLGEEDTLQNLYDEVFEEAGRRYREKIRTSKKAMKQRLDQEKIPTSSDGPRVLKHSMINPQRLFTPIVKKSSSFPNRKPITYDQKLKKNDSTPPIHPTVESKSNISTSTIDPTVKPKSNISTSTINPTIEPKSNISTSTINPTVEPKSNISTSTINTTVEPKSNISTSTINPTVESKSNLSAKDTDVYEKKSDVNFKPLQSVRPQNALQSVRPQNEPTYPVNTPLVPTHQMTNPLAPIQHMTSNLAPAQHMTSPLVPTHPVTSSSERQTFSQQWNFNRMQRVAGNQVGQGNMSAYKRTSQKPKITFIQPKKSQALYRYIGSNIPVTNITGPITSMT